MTQRVGNPFPIMFDLRGRPLTGGKVYIGAPGMDPETDPIAVFYDETLEQQANQPINVVGGFVVRDANPAMLFVDGEQYSLRVRDADGAEVFYIANAVPATNIYQPLDEDLSAIAQLSTTAFGRALLELTTAAALREYAGVVDPLPLAGGTVGGDILRSTAGAYVHMADTNYPKARIFVTANGAADPRSQVGDIWLEQEA